MKWDEHTEVLRAISSLERRIEASLDFVARLKRKSKACHIDDIAEQEKMHRLYLTKRLEALQARLKELTHECSRSEDSPP